MKKITMLLNDGEINAMRNHLKGMTKTSDAYFMRFNSKFLNAVLDAEEVDAEPEEEAEVQQ